MKIFKPLCTMHKKVGQRKLLSKKRVTFDSALQLMKNEFLNISIDVSRHQSTN